MSSMNRATTISSSTIRLRLPGIALSKFHHPFAGQSLRREIQLDRAAQLAAQAVLDQPQAKAAFFRRLDLWTAALFPAQAQPLAVGIDGPGDAHMAFAVRQRAIL